MAGYTRQDTANNIANGNVIDADDFDAEYNAIELAFASSGGHTHDGTTGGGSPITKVGPVQDLVVSATNVLPKTTNTLDLGSSGAKFKSGFFSSALNSTSITTTGGANVGGNLAVTGSTTLTGILNAPTVDIDGGAIDGTTIGTASHTTGKFTTLQSTGQATLATVDIDGGAIDGAAIGSTSPSSGAFTTLSSSGGISGNVTGTVSDVSNHDTDDIAEGSTNLYFTDQRARNTLSASGSLSYDSSTGAFTYTQGNTDTVAEGSTNLYYTGARATADAKAAISVTDSGGDGSLSYSAGVITYTGPSATETRAHFSGGTGVSITDGVVAIGQAVGTTSNVTFNNAVVNGNLTVNGTTTTVNTETLNLADNQIVLNSNETGTPTQNGGIEIERGTAANKTLVWNETDDKWTVGSETFVAGTFEGALTGAVTGNASSATTAAALTGDVSVTGDWTASSTGIIYLTTTGGNVYMRSTSTQEQLNFVLGTTEQQIVASDALKIGATGTMTLYTTTGGDIDLNPNSGRIGLFNNGFERAGLDVVTTDTLKVYTGANFGTLNSTFSGDDLTVEGDFSATTVNATTVNATTVDLGDWTITESGGTLYFATGGTNKMKLDASGNLTVTGDVTGFGTV